ncbi:G/U mismatch-specific DNA glycosylase [soil metagenome]
MARKFVKPTKEQLALASGKVSVPDLVGPGMGILFVGINPGLYSGATGLHFAKPGNRFWPALHGAGLTPRLLHPSEERELLMLGVGISKFVARATATAAELSRAEYAEGGARIRALVRTWRPRAVCFLGMGAYEAAYGVKKVKLGRQAEAFEGAEQWVLPNPSGLNANYQLGDFVRMFGEVKGSGVRQTGNGKSRRTME